MATGPIAGGGADPLIPPNTPPNLLSIQQKYAWDWFSYHASQRMTALNFFFLTVSIFAVAYSKCAEHGWCGFGCVTGIFGFITSVAFWFIDVRNEELVNCGRAALGEIEQRLHLRIREWDQNRTHLEQSTRRLSRLVFRIVTALFPRSSEDGAWGADVFAHRFWIRNMHAMAGFAFLCAAVLAAVGFPKAGAVLSWLRHFC